MLVNILIAAAAALIIGRIVCKPKLWGHPVFFGIIFGVIGGIVLAATPYFTYTPYAALAGWIVGLIAVWREQRLVNLAAGGKVDMTKMPKWKPPQAPEEQK